MKQKILGFIVIILSYILAFFLGYLVYIKTIELNLLIRFLILMLTSTITLYIISTIFKNSSIFDPYWSVLPIFGVILTFKQGSTINSLSYVMLVLIIIWGLRLTLNWAYTFKGLNKEDWRYTLYREKHPKLYPLINLGGIHLMPTIVVYLLMLTPIQFFNVTNNNLATNNFNASSIIAIIITVAAIIIETIADIEQHLNRHNSLNSLNKRGLWKYSRHPNYFGEILFWFGNYLLLISIYDKAWILFLGPLVNLLMFVFISIPLMEKRLAKKYKEYSEYQKNTNVLIPFKSKIK